MGRICPRVRCEVSDKGDKDGSRDLDDLSYNILGGTCM